MVNELETWYPVMHFEGLFEVSNFGRIKNLNYYGRGSVKILEPSAKEGKYLKVGLSKEGKIYYGWVHRLVAEAFLPPPQSGETCINHIDGNKQNNVVAEGKCNLEGCTPKQNSNNPNTKHGGYHLSEETRRRMSIAQKKRFREHPEDLQKMWNGRWKNKKRALLQQ